MQNGKFGKKKHVISIRTRKENEGEGACSLQLQAQMFYSGISGAMGITEEGNGVGPQSEGQVMELVWEAGRLRGPCESRVEKMSRYQDITGLGLRGIVQGGGQVCQGRGSFQWLLEATEGMASPLPYGKGCIVCVEW